MKSLFSIANSLVYRIAHFHRNSHRKEIFRRIGIASKRYDASALRIYLRTLELYLSGRFLPEESLSRGLADPAVPIDIHREHLAEERLHALQMRINSENAAVCRDKLMFNAFCRAHGLPVSRLLAIASKHGSRDEGGRPLNTQQRWSEFADGNSARECIAKPRGGNQGRAVRLIAREHSGNSSELADLVDEFMTLEDGGDEWMIEERICIHPAIQILTGTRAASTVRLITLIEGTEKPRVMAAHFRVIAGDSLTDNISDWRSGKYSGNIVAVPDLASGIVERAWVPSSDGVGIEWLDAHPRTGNSLKGFQIPYWDESCQLVRKAAELFLPIRTIGWDVAITPTGPLLVEGNERYQFSGFGQRLVHLHEALTRESKRLLETRRSSATPRR